MVIKRFEVPDWVRSVLICDPTDIWGNVVGMGLAELAAILSPCHRFDKRGSVLFWDTFEDGLGAWRTTTEGTLAEVELSTSGAHYGAYSIKLTGGSTGAGNARIYREGPLPVKGKLGFEASFSKPSDIQDIDFHLEYWDGINHIDGIIRYNDVDLKLQYCDVDGAWQDIVSFPSFGYGEWYFSTVKLVVDLVNGKYVRAMFNDVEYPLTDITPYTVLDSTAPSVGVGVMLHSRPGYNDVAYVDSCVLTQNEPA